MPARSWAPMHSKTGSKRCSVARCGREKRADHRSIAPDERINRKIAVRPRIRVRGMDPGQKIETGTCLPASGVKAGAGRSGNRHGQGLRVTHEQYDWKGYLRGTSTGGYSVTISSRQEPARWQRRRTHTLVPLPQESKFGPSLRPGTGRRRDSDGGRPQIPPPICFFSSKCSLRR